MTRNHGRLLVGLKTTDLSFADEVGVISGVPRECNGERRDEIRDDTREEKAWIGC